MYRRSLRGLRALGLAAIAVGLVLLPVSGATAAPLPEAIVDGSPDAGLSLQAKPENKIKRPTYARANYAWPFASGPFYGDQSGGQPDAITLPVGTFNLVGGQLDIPSQLKTVNKLGTLGAQYFLLQVDGQSFVNGMFEDLKLALGANGGSIVHEVTGGFYARLTPAALEAVRSSGIAIAVEPYHPAFKLHPAIGRAPHTDRDLALSPIYDLDVRLFAGEDANVVAQAIAGLGGNVNEIWGGDTLRVTAHRDLLPAIAGLEPVFMVFEHLPMYQTGEETGVVIEQGDNHGAGPNAPRPYTAAGIHGGNIPGSTLADAQIVMVLDTGFSTDAHDLSHSDSSYTCGAGCNATTGAGPNHRKVRAYEETDQFGGPGGDLKSCDQLSSGGKTHGHIVAATAMGNATDVNPAIFGGPGITRNDTQGNPWSMDGVGYRARLVAFDGQDTPAVGPCDSEGINPGNLYGPAVGQGSLGRAYTTFGARLSNFSFGASANVYDGNATDIDNFLFENTDAMVFVAAGNQGADDNGDNRRDEGTLGAPATTKSGLAIGATFNANTGTDEDDIAFFSSMGPAGNSGRIAPQLMAPGNDAGGVGANDGIDSEYVCSSQDNLQNDGGPITCQLVQSNQGTSYASPAAMGAAIIVRDYFAQGFYPDATRTNPNNNSDRVPTISGALVKAILIASADWVGEGNSLAGGGLVSREFRFNNEQGYGRIQLDNVLPLDTWSASPVGLIVTDGDVPGGGGPNNINGLSGTLDNQADLDSGTFEVCDPNSELRVALAWTEPAGENLSRNIDLEIINPSATKTYYGNYFTDDNNRNRQIEANEDCPPRSGGAPDNLPNGSPWSLQVCGNSVRDTVNPTEAIFLSPDADADGDNDADFNQIEPGLWTINVRGGTPNWTGPQDYAVAIAGGVCIGSSVRFVQPVHRCQGGAGIVVTEIDDPLLDPKAGLTPGEISGRTFVQVIDPGADGQIGTGDDVLIDQEDGFTFTQPDPSALRFVVENITISPETAPDFNNDVLDVMSGMTLKVVYRDEENDVANDDIERTNTASVDCEIKIGFGDLVFGQFGLDAEALIEGGCERNARGQFEFGFPDRYMDADEHLGYRLAFTMDEQEDMTDVVANLRCVKADADSPAGCLPNGAGCDPSDDPRRENNPACTEMTILNPEQLLGSITAGSALAANFTIQMGSSVVGDCANPGGGDPATCTTNAQCTVSNRCIPPTIEMVMGVSAKKSGKGVEALVVSRHKLDADEVNLFYSTDRPTGGSENLDWNNDEVLQNPTTNLGDFNLDYRFETRTWSNLKAFGRNANLQAPWDFNDNDENFRVGRNSVSDDVPDIVAYWSEDINFNNEIDGKCDSDSTRRCGLYPTDARAAGPDGGCAGLASLTCNPGTEDRDTAGNPSAGPDRGWSVDGGCGWQSTSGGNEGIWHTGRIGVPSGTCLFDLGGSGQCQSSEVLTGAANNKVVWELLLTETVEKVNQDVDSLGDPVYQVEVMDWSWNALIDIPDPWGLFTWEFDLDSESEDPQSLITDGTVLNLFGGPYGARAGGSNVALTDGYPVFAPLSTDRQTSQNGTAGTNRAGDNGCYFENGNVSSTNAETLGLSDPRDDDLDNNSAGGTDEYVTQAGPLRNFDLGHFNGVDLRFTTLEDIYGVGGNKMQGALGYISVESNGNPSPTAGFGIAIDDMVLRWREFRLDKDNTACTSTDGACAVIELQTTNFFEGNALLEITVLEKTVLNDCNFDGDTTDPGDDADCDNDGTPDVPVVATLTIPIDREEIFIPCVNPTGLTCPDGVFKGTLPISAVFDVPGTLFVQRDGTQLPVVIARYQDYNDGTNNACPNDVDSTAHGEVETSTAVFYPVGNIAIKSVKLTDNGDNDGFADTNETVDMEITVSNKSQIDVTGVVARLTTNSSRIDCIINPIIAVGDLAKGQTKTIGDDVGEDKFQFRVANVSRTGVFDDFSAQFTVTMSSGEFDALLAPQRVTIDLDLNVTGGGTPGVFTETWAGGLGAWTSVQNDNVLFPNNAAYDGMRCQYNNPDYINSNSYGETTCWMGAPGGSTQNWHIHGNGTLITAPDGGRGVDDEFSLHWGTHLASNPDLDTSRPGQMEFIHNTNPVNLSHAGNGGTPELSFKHQISLVDFRSVNAPNGEAADRGVVQVQLANPGAGGAAVGNWQKIFPYQNVYDAQGTDNYIDCLFDPSDDGNNEDSFFDPADPDRRLGPSSTCFPALSFVYQGDTDYRNPFSPTATGRGSDPDKAFAGLPTTSCAGTPACGQGTWMETRFDLSRFQGRSVRIRFLTTSIELNGVPTYEQAFSPFNPDPRDDGWFIDQVRIEPTLATAATMTIDGNANGGLAPCPEFNCGTVTADLTLDPPSPLATPGHAVELSAEGSSADSCVGGTLQFKFFLDNDASGTFTAGDTLLRNWTDNPIYVDAPSGPVTYGVDVRCSSATTCADAATEPLSVDCPDSTGTASFKYTVLVTKVSDVDAGGGSRTVQVNLGWTGKNLNIDGVKGRLVGHAGQDLRDPGVTFGNFTGTVIGCIRQKTQAATTTVGDTNTVAPGQGIYYAIAGDLCNNDSYGGVGEIGARDSEIRADGNACP